jgi:hypothetical protein
MSTSISPRDSFYCLARSSAGACASARMKFSCADLASYATFLNTADKSSSVVGGAISTT